MYYFESGKTMWLNFQSFTRQLQRNVNWSQTVDLKVLMNKPFVPKCYPLISNPGELFPNRPSLKHINWWKPFIEIYYHHCGSHGNRFQLNFATRRNGQLATHFQQRLWFPLMNFLLADIYNQYWSHCSN